MEWVPEIGTHLTKVFLPLSQGLSDVGSDTLSETYSFSDSIHLYVQSLLLGILSLGLSWIFVRTSLAKTILPWFHVAISYILAFFLLKYGLEKWTRLQFPTPPPNILHAEVGSLDKDILFWSLMGTSKVYAGFMGLVEIAAGILLLFRRTRFLAGYISLGVFANILALNIGFDITVKSLSLALLIGSLFIVGPSIRSLVQLLTSQTTIPIEVPKVNIRPMIKRFLKGFAIALILFECGLPIFDRSYSSPSDASINHQTFAVITTQKTPENIPNLQYKHLHFHPHGFLITETFDGRFSSYPIRLPEGANQFKLVDGNTTIQVTRNGNEWLFTEKSQLLWRCIRVKNESLPLLQDNFHWTVEGMVPK